MDFTLTDEQSCCATPRGAVAEGVPVVAWSEPTSTDPSVADGAGAQRHLRDWAVWATARSPTSACSCEEPARAPRPVRSSRPSAMFAPLIVRGRPLVRRRVADGDGDRHGRGGRPRRDVGRER